MKALILNSGMGSRMGEETRLHPKCLTKIDEQNTILSRQLRQLEKYGIKEVVITTGYLSDSIENYCKEQGFKLDITFVNNELYESTNYIYSIYLARDILMNQDILLMHGDLVFDDEVLGGVLNCKDSCVTVDSTLELPEKDFKGVITDDLIRAIGIEFFDNSLALQPLYRMTADEWNIWLDEIIKFCGDGITNCYAEKALNEVADRMMLRPFDVMGGLCSEIDNISDLKKVQNRLIQ